MKYSYKLKLIPALIIVFGIFGAINFTYAQEQSATSTTQTPDTTAPVIVMLGTNPVNLNVGDPYVDAGANANDNIDGQVKVTTISNNVNTAVAGTYSVVYQAVDSSNNVATATRTVNVIDPQASQQQSGGSGGTPSGPTEKVIIRNGGTLIWQGNISLQPAGNETIQDSSGNSHSINTQSVLAVIEQAVTASNQAFTLSNLQFDISYNEFYIKCVTSSGNQSCDNWQYEVGSSIPQVGIDQDILTDSETIGLYFGNPHQVVFDTTSITAGGTINATAQTYNYVDNTWSGLTGVHIGITTPNPNDPYNPNVVLSVPVNASGSASLAIPQAGTYSAGISEDYYYPSYTITVTSPSSGGAAGSINNQITFNVQKALGYLESVQNKDGSFGSGDMYTDWASIAYGSLGVKDASENSIISYLLKNSKVSSVVTDNERRAMALMALGQNPYSFGGTDYITPIVNSFDGKQFGDSTLINDDIFALITLNSAGYTSSDTIISKDINYVISQQEADGSWGENADMTAAAVSALNAFGYTKSNASVNKALLYLQGSQLLDGSWGNIYSTSWVMQAMSVSDSVWIKGNTTPAQYLATQQTADGAALLATETLSNRIWATSYAIPAALGKTWNAIMVSFAKPANIASNNDSSTINGSGGQLYGSTSTATSTNNSNVTATSTITTSVNTNSNSGKIVSTIKNQLASVFTNSKKSDNSSNSATSTNTDLATSTATTTDIATSTLGASVINSGFSPFEKDAGIASIIVLIIIGGFFAVKKIKNNK